jgi:hypothetical protein
MRVYSEEGTWEASEPSFEQDVSSLQKEEKYAFYV